MKRLILFSALLFCFSMGFAQESNDQEHVVKEYATVYQGIKKIAILYGDNKQEYIEYTSKGRVSDVMTVLNRLSKEDWTVIASGNPAIYLLERKL